MAHDISDRIVEQAIGHGLVDGTVLYTDSTHLKANANKGKYDLQMIEKSRFDYWADLDRAIEAERALYSGYMVRDGKPKGFFSRSPHGGRPACDHHL